MSKKPLWQSIETAPKDESILAGAIHKTYGWLWFRAKYYRFPELGKEEWIGDNGMSPTHWMPLPDPPTEP